jgi:hypothetical protein
MTGALCDYYYSRLDYFLKQTPYIISSAEYEIQLAMQYIYRTAGSCEKYGMKELADEISDRVENYYARYLQIVGPATRQ